MGQVKHPVAKSSFVFAHWITFLISQPQRDARTVMVIRRIKILISLQDGPLHADNFQTTAVWLYQLGGRMLREICPISLIAMVGDAQAVSRQERGEVQAANTSTMM